MCGVDTAYNYRDFTAHRRLAQAAGDLLTEFTLSTKVGFFPGNGGHTTHSLHPDRLRTAIEQTTEDLGRTPDIVFLHNPERTLSGLSPDEGSDRFARACATLADAVRSGLARGWGLATWDPRPVATTILGGTLDHVPEVLLVRAGLTVPDVVLTAAETISAACRIAPQMRWGMSPFAGNTTEPVWQCADLSAFTPSHRQTPAIPVAFRLGYELPSVTRLAVGTRDRAHLTDLIAAIDIDIDSDAITQYRQLIRTDTTAPTPEHP